MGADGLCERCSCLLHTKPLTRARRWEGGELLYKQAFKINCFSSLEQELAFQPQDTIRACSDCICSGAVYSQGLFGRDRLKFFGRKESSYQGLCPPGAGNCYSANGSDYHVFTTRNGVFASYNFSSPWNLCCEPIFTPNSCLSWFVTACCALILLINPMYLIG